MLIKNKIVQSLNIIAVPLIIQAISNLVIGITDQAMIGRISVSAFGAVGSVYQLISILVGIMGCTVIIFNINGSRALGKSARDEFYEEFTSSIMLSFTLGVILLLVITFFKKFILVTVFGFSGSLLKDALDYIGIVKWNILIQMLIFSANTYFKINKETKYILAVSLFSSLLNLLLDYILIFGKIGFSPMGVNGAGYATVISLFANLIIYLVICYKDIRIYTKKARIYFRRAWANLQLSLPIMGQEIMENNVFMMVITAIVSRKGEVALAAYLLLIQVINILLMPKYMYGAATLTLVSENTESNEYSINRIPKYAIISTLIVFLFASLVIFIFRMDIFYLINPNESVVSLTASLFLVFLISSVVKIPSTIYSYSLQAVGQSKFVLYSSAAINIFTMGVLLLLAYFIKNSVYLFLFFSALSLAVNYGVISLVFKLRYQKKCSEMENLNSGTLSA